jgi:hypothetical protein
MLLQKQKPVSMRRTASNPISELSNCMESCSVTTAGAVHLTNKLLTPPRPPSHHFLSRFQKLTSRQQLVPNLVPATFRRISNPECNFPCLSQFPLSQIIREADIISSISPSFQKIILPWVVEIGLVEAAGSAFPFPCKRKRMTCM